MGKAYANLKGEMIMVYIANVKGKNGIEEWNVKADSLIGACAKIADHVDGELIGIRLFEGVDE